MKKKTLHLIAAARPNFVKIAPLYHALSKTLWANAIIIHTGQHYDTNMSDVFFEDLSIPKPHYHLNIGSGSHAKQTGETMYAYEQLCLQSSPDMVIVFGDVNATMACAIAAKKLQIPVAHVEAGLRSGDRSMPEEINRILTDSISDLYFTPSIDANENLIAEGVSENKIFLTGNIMIDAYEKLRKKILTQAEYIKYSVKEKTYGVITLHRPSNVDDETTLTKIVDALCLTSMKIPLIFPAHPRTLKMLQHFSLLRKIEKMPNIYLTTPLNYIKFLSLVSHAKFILTDSGGIQEETTYLGVPCLTLRNTTERPITITQGTNELITLDNLLPSLKLIINDQWKESAVPQYWDGKAAERITNELNNFFTKGNYLNETNSPII